MKSGNFFGENLHYFNSVLQTAFDWFTFFY